MSVEATADMLPSLPTVRPFLILGSVELTLAIGFIVAREQGMRRDEQAIAEVGEARSQSAHAVPPARRTPPFILSARRG